MTTQIAVRLPLPLGVAGAIMELVGTAWPGSTIVPQEGGGLFGPRELVMAIGDHDPVPVDPAEARALAEKAGLDGPMLEKFGPDGLSLSGTEAFNEPLVKACTAGFAANPDAVNYLEYELMRSDDDRRYVVIFARSKGQTPHELRQAAEQRFVDAEAAVQVLLGQGAGGSFEDGVRAALEAIRGVAA